MKQPRGSKALRRRRARDDDSPNEATSVTGEPSGRELSDRDAVRSSQRIASQLHQLIATSITMGGLRTEREILESLTTSTQRVFDADVAVLSLESGAAAPLRAEARRGRAPRSLGANELDGGEVVPRTRPGAIAPWVDDDWLIAPVLEHRGVARGVLAIRRGEDEFLPEEREVLTLLAQMASTSLGATELSRSIEASETRLRILVDTAPAGIIEVDLNGGIRWWNRAASRIFEWPIYESDTAQAERFPEGAADGLAALWADVLGGALTSTRDLVEVEIKGRRRDLTASAALLPSPDDEVSSILMLVDDVTDHRQLKAEVHHAQQMEIRGRVASSVAHDFNNLLTLISGYAEILAKDLDADSKSLAMVKDIQSTASRASMLTAQLQTIGRSASLEPEVLDPVAVLQSNAEVLERILGDEIDLQWSLEDAGGAIRVDPGQFEQMILNLAINARDAMPDGGELRISVGPIEADRLRREPRGDADRDSGDFLVITVTDTGIGMDEETRAHCFDPFFTTKGPFKGTGLGLAAARRLVEGSGGVIRCQSKLGVGTNFEIIFPTTDEVVPETTSVAVAERPRGSATVLVAEDDDGLRQLMVRVLSRNGYQVLVAESGERALEVAGDYEGTIDLLVSDVVMLDVDGAELAAALQRTHPSLRVLMTSGTADASIVNHLTPGTAAFLAKPYRPSALIDQVHELLSRR